MELTSRMAALSALALLSISLGVASFPYFLNKTSSNMETTSEFYASANQDINDLLQGKDFPTLEVDNQKIEVDQEINPLEWARSNDTIDGDISSNIVVYGSVDNKKKGVYTLRYSVRNSFGLRSEKKIQVIVD